MECTFDNSLDRSHFLKALLGINGGGPNSSVRFMQVESVGQYFACDHSREIDGWEGLFQLLLDTNVCGHPAIRVDITTDDHLCAIPLSCNNGESEWFTDWKDAIGVGADGHPVLKIMLSNILS